MKKSLMILASVALGASMASAADVESKNVVGFVTLTNVTPGSFTPIGVNFESCTNSAINVQDLFDPSQLYGAQILDGEEYVADLENSDQIMFWTGVGYKPYFYDSIEQVWTAGFTPMTNVLKKGDAFFYKRAIGSTSSNLTVFGQVSASTNFIHDAIEQGFQPIAMAYPIERSVNSLQLNGYGAQILDGEEYVADLENSDQLLFWTGIGYKPYFYDGIANEWTTGFAPLTASIPLGKAVFYKRIAASDLVWNEIK